MNKEVQVQLKTILRDRKIGEVFIVNGLPCPHTDIDHSMAGQFIAYQSMLTDLGFAATYFQRCRDEEDSLVRRALLEAAVVKYMRCFVQSDGRGLKLDGNSKLIPEELKRFHDQLKTLRHQLVAHAGNSLYERLKGVAIIHPVTQRLVTVTTTHNALAEMDPQFFEAFVELSKCVLRGVAKKAQELRVRIECDLASKDFADSRTPLSDPQATLAHAEHIIDAGTQMVSVAYWPTEP